MKKPNIVALPTSQMMVFLDYFLIDWVSLPTVEDQILALEAVPQVDWSKLKVGVDTRAAETVEDDIVLRRMVSLGRADAPPEPEPDLPDLSRESAPEDDEELTAPPDLTGLPGED